MSFPTISVSKLAQQNYLQTLYQTGSTMNSFPVNVVITGSTFSTFKCFGNTFTAYVYLQSGAAANFGGSGSIYYIDWSPDGITFFGAVGSGSGYSGSINVPGVWTAIQWTGSAPFYRFLLKNITGSAISGSIVIYGR